MSISTDRNSRSYKQRRVCDTCGEKHPTGLHCYKVSRKNKVALGDNSQTWFITHHEVYHPSNLGNIRVVFDCNAEYDGVSKNKRLLCGPDLTNQVVGILVNLERIIWKSCQILKPCFTKCLWQTSIEVYLAFFGGKMEILIGNHKSTI